MLIEDVACPVDKLGDMTQDLVDMFQKFGYKDASCFGHALEGNLHLVFSQVWSFTPSAYPCLLPVVHSFFYTGSEVCHSIHPGCSGAVLCPGRGWGQAFCMPSGGLLSVTQVLCACCAS